MENIKRFKAYKISNMQYITGGREVQKTNSSSLTDIDNSKDKIIFYDDGCSTKVINNTGFINWITGKREVKTYNYCTPGFENEPVQVD